MIRSIASLLGRASPRKPWRAFVRHEGGVTVIEFALLALPFFAIMAAILETSLIFMSGQILESAVQDASRMIRTGQAQQRGDTLASFRSNVCDRLYGLFSDCSGLHVQVSVVSNFQSATVEAPVDWNCKADNCGWTKDEDYRAGQGSNVVLVQVYFKFPVILNLNFLTGGSLGMANLNDGRRLLGAVTVFRNEPFT
jgi:Flp pilus assembly protein TadG